MTRYRALSRLVPALFATMSVGVVSLLGCSDGLAPASRSQPTVAAVVRLKGQAHGGQQPISGSTIQLYAVGINGSRSAATPLLTTTVVTDQNGSFNLTGDWDCTSNTATYGVNPLLYIVASGGNPGLSSGTNNTAILLMAAIGPCNTLTSSSFISMNELTTVAAVYALTPFMADVAHVGASGVNPAGLVNAFSSASMLVNWTTGAVPGNLLPASGTAPVAELNSLADIIAACVNSSGVGNPCSALFSAATPTTGGTKPTDIVGALLNVASNPASQAANLFDVIQPTAPFAPLLGSPPNDWTMALKFTGGGLNAPAALAVDAAGDVWVANAGGNSVSELSPTGTQLTGSTGYTAGGKLLGAQGIAVDRAGNVWVANTMLNSVVELSVSNGAIQSGSSFTAGGIDGPKGIAIDSQNNVWIANFAGGSVTELNSAGGSVGGSPLTAAGTLQAPSAIAVDAAGRVWVADEVGSVVAEFASNQTLMSGTGNSDDAIFAPQGVAIDSGGHAWVTYQGTNAASYFSNSLNASVATPYTGGGLSMPTAVAIDGGDNVWITNNRTAGTLTKLTLSQTTPLTPASGLGSLNAPLGIAIDASGNVWTANAGDNSVSEFIGAALPAKVPLAANVGP
jgi:streptogramin lyase